MKPKRERLELIYDILKSIKEKNGKIKPTHIMYKANLSPKMLNEYLEYLIQNNFINETKDGKNKSYSLTLRGFDYLNKYSVIVEFVDSFGL